MDQINRERHIEYLVACIDQWRREVWLDSDTKEALIQAADLEISRLKGGKPRKISGAMAITLDKTHALGTGELEDFEAWKDH